VEEEGNE